MDKKYYFRDFLNQGSKGTAFIEVRAYTYPADKYDSSSFSGTIKLADCDKNIELSFYANTEERKQKRLVKIDMLINQLNNFRAELEAYSFEPANKDLPSRHGEETFPLERMLDLNAGDIVTVPGEE